jgi:hypothetical protein
MKYVKSQETFSEIAACWEDGGQYLRSFTTREKQTLNS